MWWAVAFAAAEPLDAQVGGPPVEFHLPLSRLPAAGDRALAVSEGRLLDQQEEPGGLRVLVQPGDGRQARMLALAYLDLSAPNHEPQLALARLSARQQANITAEPGNSVTLKVAGRSWGPFVADATGQARVSFEIPPGVVSYEVLVSDDVGNTQRLRAALPGPFSPVLVSMEALRPEGGADVWVGAYTATGLPWSGSPPTCRAGAALPSPSEPASPGLYRFRLPPTDPLDTRIDLQIGRAHV